MNTIIEQIKAEIERRMKILREDDVVRQNCTSDFLEGKIYGYEEILSLLATLESEKPVPNDLEEAAKKYAEESCFDDPEFTATMLAYKAGAKWQKEQMMKGAMEYEVGMHGEPIKITLDKYVQRAKCIFPGDKVRVIVIPNTDKK
jgi:hypothetical protein